MVEDFYRVQGWNFLISIIVRCQTKPQSGKYSWGRWDFWVFISKYRTWTLLLYANHLCHSSHHETEGGVWKGPPSQGKIPSAASRVCLCLNTAVQVYLSLINLYFFTFPTAGKSFLTWNKILLWFLAQHRKKVLSSFTCRSSAVYSEIMPTLFSLLGSISRFPLLLISIFCMLSHWPNFRHRLLC